MYICIEGGIGVGKTSLTNILCEEFDLNKKLEIVEENPYLKDFYEDMEGFAFQTEMFFLTHRYGQVKNLHKEITSGIVSDYTIYKNKLFANLNLQNGDLDKFNKVFEVLTEGLPQPDLLIFLKADVETLKKRIMMRDRKFEQDIDSQYLQDLIDTYQHYFNELINYSASNVLVVECDNIDFVFNDNDKQKLLSTISQKIKELNE
ncbi:deoxynucleoside kinase [Mollicutes bacterium LVI A0078]|nr:deoxynucleoside kinase [Mollicutes bacterium LVI A0075]WOO91656.1 deoxynucleoside kinase [Mollicutes bacterium LVI A0078]